MKYILITEVKIKLKEKKISMKDISRDFNKNYLTILRWFRGKITLNQLDIICRFYNITVSKLELK